MINPDKIEELTSLDEDGSNTLLKELIQLYLSSTPPKVKRISELFYLKNLTELKKEAHSLRSSSLTMGADEMAKVAAEIEYSNNDDQTEDYLRSRIKILIQEFEIVKAELSSYL